jgi:hypothetical protein
VEFFYFFSFFLFFLFFLFFYFSIFLFFYFFSDFFILLVVFFIFFIFYEKKICLPCSGPVAWRTHSAANMLIEVFHWVRSHHPYWDRKGGSDHILVSHAYSHATFTGSSCKGIEEEHAARAAAIPSCSGEKLLARDVMAGHLLL